jgi:hypothetical protein
MTRFVKCVDQTIDEDYNLDIFQQTISTSEPTKGVITIQQAWSQKGH